MSKAYRSSDIFREALRVVVAIVIGVFGLFGGAIGGGVGFMIGGDVLGVIFLILGIVIVVGGGSALLSSERQRLRPLLIPPTPLDRLRHHLQTLAPALYAKVLADTLTDICEEHSLAASPFKAHCVLLRGYCALGAAAACQFGYSLLDRIAAVWRRTRSLK